MRSKLLHESNGQRTFAVILDTGDEIMISITMLAEREAVTAAQFTAIGAVSDATLG